MATTTSGLTRRRGGGGAATTNNGDDEVARVSSPVPKRNDDRTPETSYENSANGHKIAYDPRDISDNAERSKQPKLTLMEEVILMGLKDKQVRAGRREPPPPRELTTHRATSPFGTTISPTLSEDVSS